MRPNRSWEESHGRKLTGIAASSGIAMGRAFILSEPQLKSPYQTIEPQEVQAELARTRDAFSASRTQLEAIRVRERFLKLKMGQLRRAY